jgi:hypothetical protein
MVITHSLARNETTNAVLVWGLLAVVLLTASLSVLTSAVPWGAFAVMVIVLVSLPALLTRDWRVMIPWPLALFVTIPVVARALGFSPELMGYVAISGLALVAVVEIDAFTDVEMSRRIAVLFAALTTLAFQSWWIVAQYYSDRWLGTELLESQTELQWDLVAVTAVTLVMGGFFLWYFGRIEHVGYRGRPVVPEEES